MTRSGELHVTKECSAYKGLAGDICTITSSNLEEIEVGSKVVYAQAAGAGALDTDVVLDAGRGNTGAGHVVLDLAAGSGVATFSGGTGKFSGFEPVSMSRPMRPDCGTGKGRTASVRAIEPGSASTPGRVGRVAKRIAQLGSRLGTTSHPAARPA